MHQHDGTVLHAAHHGVVHRVGIAELPVLGVYRPVHQNGLQFPRHGAHLLVGAAVGQAHQYVFHTRYFPDLIPGLGDLRFNIRRALLGKVRVAPAVVAQFVALLRHAADGVGEGGNIPAHHEEGALAAVLNKRIQQVGGIAAGAVVKGEGDHGFGRIGIGRRLFFHRGFFLCGRLFHHRQFLHSRFLCRGLLHVQLLCGGVGGIPAGCRPAEQGGQQEQSRQHQRKTRQAAAGPYRLFRAFAPHGLTPLSEKMTYSIRRFLSKNVYTQFADFCIFFDKGKKTPGRTGCFCCFYRNVGGYTPSAWSRRSFSATSMRSA